MRYRPFGPSGKTVSAISLLLRETASVPTPAAWRSALYTAFESGINCFEISDGGPVLNAGVAAAISAVERGLLFLAWRISGDARRPLSAEVLSRALRSTLQGTRAGYFDLLTLDEAAFESLTKDGRALLDDIRAAGLALQIGLVGDGDAVEAVIADPSFEVIVMPFGLTSDWRARRRVKDASQANMTAIAYDCVPAELIRPPQRPVAPVLRGKRQSALAGAGTYAFLHHTQGWAPEEICIAYALTEPAFATLQLDVAAGVDFERLAAVPDRDLPTGVAAQIEMARFSVERGPEQRRA